MNDVREPEELKAWQALDEPGAAPLLAAAAACDADSPAAIERLRRTWPAAQVRAALSLIRARRMLEGRIDGAEHLLADPAGAEQASGSDAAAWKARRFAALGRPIADLCCGIGGDLLHLRHAAPSRGVDLDPLRVFMAQRNTGCPVTCQDVHSAQLEDGEAFHLDPARRDAQGRRRHDWHQLVPGPTVIEALIGGDHAGAIKLGPGLDFSSIPDASRIEIEIIGSHRRLVQAVLWSGALATAGMRRATRLPEGRTIIGVPRPPQPTPRGDRLDVLHVPDPALERAGLVGTLTADGPLGELHPGIGLLSGAYRSSLPENVCAWVTSFRVIETMPFRLDRVEARLSALGANVVEVRTRGGAIDVDAAQRHFGRGGGHADTVVFALRLGRSRVAYIVRPERTGG